MHHGTYGVLQAHSLQRMPIKSNPRSHIIGLPYKCNYHNVIGVALIRKNPYCSIKNLSLSDPSAAEESKKGCKKYKFIRRKLHAFLEYETGETAAKVTTALNNEQDWEMGCMLSFLNKQGKEQRRLTMKKVDPEKDSRPST
ncbi:hypothetical protein N665_1291s0005 [Sinapis alba]|nr:hypothetical protein N665_1291s0005 [Sinapis alba]